MDDDYLVPVVGTDDATVEGGFVMAEQATENVAPKVRTKEVVTIENIDLTGKGPNKDVLLDLVQREQRRRNSIKGWTVHDHMMIFGSLGLAGCLLAVSIHHLAGGLGTRTGIAMWEAWCLAVFFDCACVLSKLYLADVVRRLRTHWFIAGTATGMIVTVFGFSVFLNMLAFGGTTLGNALGWTVPSMVLALSILGFWKLGEKLGHE